MEANSNSTPMDLVGAVALAASLAFSNNQNLQPLAMSLLGIALMSSGVSLARANGAGAYMYLPTISTALATCVAGFGIHATEPIPRTVVAITAMVSVFLQCVVELSEADIAEHGRLLDAEYTQLE